MAEGLKIWGGGWGRQLVIQVLSLLMDHVLLNFSQNLGEGDRNLPLCPLGPPVPLAPLVLSALLRLVANQETKPQNGAIALNR